jgi:hypothetical protein
VIVSLGTTRRATSALVAKIIVTQAHSSAVSVHLSDPLAAAIAVLSRM